jgi:hypothetical protein
MQPAWLSQSEQHRVEAVRAQYEDSMHGGHNTCDRPAEWHCQVRRGTRSDGGAARAKELGASVGVGFSLAAYTRWGRVRVMGGDNKGRGGGGGWRLAQRREMKGPRGALRPGWCLRPTTLVPSSATQQQAMMTVVSVFVTRGITPWSRRVAATSSTFRPIMTSTQDVPTCLDPALACPPLRSSSKASLPVAEKLKMVVVALDFEELSSVCARSPPSQALASSHRRRG